ncbi:MAG: amidohydrolase family protein, partial [Elusimicrobia bacterium]|nr:amidohydrolase family protein [Elusimicrobiota bacterium]
FGVIGLETARGVVLTFSVHEGRLRRKDLVRRMGCAPARILGLARKGTLAPGSDADATVVDPRRAWTVPARFRSLSRNSPFRGLRLRRRARATIVSGRIVHAL